MVTSFKLLFTLMCMMLCALVLGQGGPPPGPWVISISPKRTRVLTYSNGQQDAPFVLTVYWNGSGAAPSGATFNWSGTLDYAGDTTTQTTTGHLHAPGFAEPSCTVTVNGQQTVALGAYVYAFGGPIKFAVTPGDVTTWTHDGGSSSASWFIEYFNYTHKSPAPAGFQKTQNASVTPLMSQCPMATTTVTWSLPGNVYSAALAGGTTVSSTTVVDVQGEKDFTSQPVTCTYNFSVSSPSGNLTDSGVDDTVASGLVNTISSHLPGSAASGSGTPDEPSANAGLGYCGSDYTPKVKDTAGSPFYGLWIQERFTTAFPPGTFDWNGSVTPNIFWTTKTTGAFDSVDWLRYIWAANDDTQYPLTHHYWAATKSVSSGGVDLGAFVITFTWGMPGTATQTP